MKIKNKKLVIVIVLIIGFCVNISFVSAKSNSDCEGFAVMKYKNENSSENGFMIINQVRGTPYIYSKFLSTDQQLAIIDKGSLNTAMLNLKKYCCEKELGGLSMKSETCKNDKEFYNDNIIDSPYLFDHLFDVIMRRFSGLRGEYDIYNKIEMLSDDKGLEWRAWINSQAENATGSNPQIIIDKYKEFWQPSSPQSGFDIAEKISVTFGDLSDEAFLTYVSGQGGTQESEAVAQAFKNYDAWTLYDRYNNACAIAQYLYALLDIGVSSEDKIKTIHILAQGVCKQAVNNQKSNENSYVKLVIQKSGSLFLQNYVQGYLSYLYDRAGRLETTWKTASDRFLDVVRAVPKLVKNCVK